MPGNRRSLPAAMPSFAASSCPASLSIASFADVLLSIADVSAIESTNIFVVSNTFVLELDIWKSLPSRWRSLNLTYLDKIV